MDLLSSITQKNKLKESVKKIIEKYPDRVPVYVTRGKGDKHLKNIDQNKFIVPEDITVAQFMTIIRKKIDLSPEMALFLFCKQRNSSCTIGLFQFVPYL